MVLMSLLTVVMVLADGGINLTFQGGDIVGSVSIWWFVILLVIVFLWHLLGSRRGGIR